MYLLRVREDAYAGYVDETRLDYIPPPICAVRSAPVE